ncbi:hypothetical protein [Sphingomonas abietis]|uniref:IS110 family transposase n=1 Tax=Sphingomonas abietis TaxID=3012344 RepID=A0ABY7NM17_9SPHN|nr:hypothetical protein [Sphingomonas abietis]WBO22277.1 hypothetical protein PBT88_19360 [Sphingomonas abietis]
MTKAAIGDIEPHPKRCVSLTMLVTLFSTPRQRRLAHNKAIFAAKRHGERGPAILRIKARLTHSRYRHFVYLLASRKNIRDPGPIHP